MPERRPLETLASLAPDGEEGAGERRVPLLPWSFAGMGLLVAWLCCTHLPNMFTSVASVGAQAEAFVDYLMRAGDVGTFLAVVALGRRIGPLSRHRAVCGALVGLAALATWLDPLLAARLGTGLPLAASGLATGVGGAVLFLLWAEVYGQLGPTRCVVFGSVSCMLAGLAALAVSCMAEPAADVAVALLLPVSGVMAGVSLTRLPGEPAGRKGAPAGTRDLRYPVPWKLVALMALAGFASGFAGALLVDADGMGARHRVAATAVFGALLLAAFVLRRGNLDVRILAWFTLPVAVVAFAAIPLLGSTFGAVLSFLVKFSYVAFALFVLLVLATVVWRYEVPSARVFASARAASEGAMLAGIVLRRWMRAAGLLDSGATLWLIALIGLVAVVGCVVVWHSERSVTSDWGTVGVDPASGLHVPSRGELVRARCGALAAERGLTPREREVLELLADGLEPAQIEQELFLSHNTLKTHLRHIYAKLGVHTREEAAALARAV